MVVDFCGHWFKLVDLNALLPIDLKRFLVGHPTLPRKQQHVDGLIPHRPVIDGQKLLADELGEGYNLVPEAVGRTRGFMG